MTPAEAQRKHEALSRRIKALDDDISRELDGEHRLVLDERRAELVRERDALYAQAAAAPAAPATPAPSVSTDFDVLQRKVAELGQALSDGHPAKAQAIITDCMTALQTLQKEIDGLTVRVGNIERQLNPPPVVKAWRAAAFVVLLAGLLIGWWQTPILFDLYPVVGLAFEVVILLLAAACLMLARAELREHKP